MCSRMESLIEQNKLLSPSLHGFRKTHSTQHAFLDIINTIQTNMDQRLLSYGVFLNLKIKKLLTRSIITFFSRS